MRVISQDGTTDTPYDLSMIWVREKYGYSIMAGMPNDEPISLGMYSSREKALKAMEMLREAYAGKPILNVDEIPNLTPQEFGEKLGTGDILLCNKTNADVGFSSNYYFQFPKDDEVEV